ncbi:glutathione S-transferase family protein [Labrys sp. KB_33_2]|uniref:glutathione S-transferase family protein n=1 Tax=Labrys sp. KB_33_2 TaxID=3237479 RepID=UPI003F9347DC
MIYFYTSTSPNGYKVAICLEELGLSYRVFVVNLSKGEQRASKFLALNPNGRIPVIFDHKTDQVLFESGAILLYLAETSGRLIPVSGAKRWDVINWLFLHSAAIGPALGQRVNFSIFAKDKIPNVINHFVDETERLYGILNERLCDRQFLCGDYSIADIANFGWLHIAKLTGFSFDKFEALSAWYERVAARPAVARGLAVPEPALGP